MDSLQLITIIIFLCTSIYIWNMRRFYYVTFINIYELLGSNEDIMQKMIKLINKFGLPKKLWIGRKLLVVIGKPEDVHTILNSKECLEKGEFYEGMAEFLGQSIFTCQDVSRWRQSRKLIVPSFNIAILNSFIPIFEKQALVLCEILQKMVDQTNFDVYDFFSNCNLDIICETFMGVTVNAQMGGCDYAKWIDRLLELAFKRLFHPLYRFDIIFNLTSQGKEVKQLIKSVKDYSNNIIKIRKQICKQHKKDQPMETRKKVYLDYIIEISEETEHFSESDICDEVALMVLAAHDTTTTVECFILMLLGMHPEIQERAFEEQQNIFGDTMRSITLDDIALMKYLELIIKETLRLFPPVPFHARKIMEDTNLSNCTLPKGTICILAPYFTHRDPKLWKDPLKFNPDRFLPEESAQRHPYAWFPFSGGPRNCLGIKYGMMAMKVVISIVIRRYKIFCDYKQLEDITLRADMKLKSVEGHRIRLQLRKPIK